MYICLSLNSLPPTENVLSIAQSSIISVLKASSVESAGFIRFSLMCVHKCARVRVHKNCERNSKATEMNEHHVKYDHSCFQSISRNLILQGKVNIFRQDLRFLQQCL
jgi:hypothetical protein